MLALLLMIQTGPPIIAYPAPGTPEWYAARRGPTPAQPPTPPRLDAKREIADGTRMANAFLNWKACALSKARGYAFTSTESATVVAEAAIGACEMKLYTAKIAIVSAGDGAIFSLSQADEMVRDNVTKARPALINAVLEARAGRRTAKRH